MFAQHFQKAANPPQPILPSSALTPREILALISPADPLTASMAPAPGEDWLDDGPEFPGFKKNHRFLMDLVLGESRDDLGDRILRMLDDGEGKVQLKQRREVCLRLKKALDRRRATALATALGRMRGWLQRNLRFEKAFQRLSGTLAFRNRRSLRQYFEILRVSKDDSTYRQGKASRGKIFFLVEVLGRHLNSSVRRAFVSLAKNRVATSEASRSQNAAFRLNEVAMASIISQLNQINHKIGSSHPEGGLVSEDSRFSAAKPTFAKSRPPQPPRTLVAPAFEWNTPGKDHPMSPASRTQSFKEQNRSLARYLGSQRFATEVEESLVLSATTGCRTNSRSKKTREYVSVRELYF